MEHLFKNKLRIVSVLVCLGVFAVTSGVLALEVGWPNSPAGTSLNEGSQLVDFIKYLYEWGISIGGFIAFIALLIAGLKYLTSAGNATKMSDAMNRIKAAGLGLVLLLASVLILNTLNPQLTVLKMPTEFADTKITEVKIDRDLSPSVLCEKATVFSAEEQKGSSAEVEITDCQPNPLGAPIQSISVYGSCQIKLYETATDCNEDHFIGGVPVIIQTFGKEITEEDKVQHYDSVKTITNSDTSVYSISVQPINYAIDTDF